jgi:nitrogenase molybdenum-iron protein alpha/beta subunit
VGDNIVAVCEDIQPKVDFEIVPIECAGFRGSQYDGVDIALDALLKKLVVDGRQKVSNSICIIAPSFAIVREDSTGNPAVASRGFILRSGTIMGYDYKGAIHVHSTYSDGTGTVEEIMQAANEAGLDFVVITTTHDRWRATGCQAAACARVRVAAHGSARRLPPHGVTSTPTP